MAGCGNVFAKEVGSEYLDKAGRSPVRACKILCFSYFLIHDQMGSRSLREYGTQEGRSAHFYSGDLQQLFRSGERHPRDSELSAEFPGYEWLVVGRYVEVEFGLLPVAKEERLDDPASYLLIDPLTVFHRKARVCVHPAEGYTKVLECFVNSPLKFRLELFGSGMDDLTYFEHSLSTSVNQGLRRSMAWEVVKAGPPSNPLPSIHEKTAMYRSLL